MTTPCKFCGRLVVKRKYCSIICRDMGRWGAYKKKKYFCPICKTKEIARKIKHCKPCRWLKNKIQSTCAACGIDIFSFPGRPRRVCSKRCLYRSYVGSGNPHWMGGITKPNKKIRASREYADWRKSVFERDNFTCGFCGKRGRQLHADHIKQFAIFHDLRFSVPNGRTLCVPCHKKTPTYLNGTKVINRNAGFAESISQAEDIIHGRNTD